MPRSPIPGTRPGWLMTLPVALMMALPCGAQASNFIPTDDGEVVETLPRTFGVERAARSRSDSPLTDPAAAAVEARRWIEAARTESDPRYLGYARAALAAWWDSDEPPAEVLLQRALLRQRMHDFEPAIRDLERLLGHAPGHRQARLALAMIRQVQGDLTGARLECGALMRAAADAVAWLCEASVLGLTGQAERALSLLGVLRPQFAKASPDLRQWAETLSAEIAARLGHDEVAEGHFRAALDALRRDPYLLRQWADFLLGQGRAAEVAALLADEARDEGLLVRLAQAYSLQNDPRAAALCALLDARFEAARLSGSVLHRADEARYLLAFDGDRRRAMQLALENWATQRAPEDAHLVLEAALAARDAAAARPAIEWLRRSGLEDVRVAELIRQIEAVMP